MDPHDFSTAVLELATVLAFQNASTVGHPGEEVVDVGQHGETHTLKSPGLFS